MKKVNNNQEEIILLLTIQQMLHNWDTRKDMIQLIDEFIFNNN